MNEMSNSPVQIEPIHTFSSGRGDRARAHSYYHNELDVQHKGTNWTYSTKELSCGHKAITEMNG